MKMKKKNMKEKKVNGFSLFFCRSWTPWVEKIEEWRKGCFSWKEFLALLLSFSSCLTLDIKRRIGTFEGSEWKRRDSKLKERKLKERKLKEKEGRNENSNEMK